MVNIHVNDNTNPIRINVNPISNSVSSTIGNEAFYNGLAKEWAISPELVQGEDYSAKYYAGQAKQAEQTATEAISNIGTSVEDAAGYAQSAQESAEYIVNNAPEASIEQTSTGAIITTKDLTHGTTTATILNGAKGDKGDTGEKGEKGETGAKGDKGDTGDDGYSPTATVSKSGNTATITITDKNGTTTANVYDGVGSITDVQVDGTSVLDGSIAKIDLTGKYDASNPNGYTSNVGTVTSVNNTQPDASGNVTLTIPDTSNLANKDLSNLSSTGNAKFQAPLVSGTNIKTINNNSILGSGDLTLDGLPSQTGQSGKFLTTDGTDASWGNLPVATASTVGVVKPDNASIRVDNDGTISAICRNVGEVITSTLPLTDAGLHLLDGTLLQYGIYKEFIDYIADLYAENPTANYFTDETTWQASVTQYGSCGKFVYDSTNNTVRLPKVSDILQSTTDINALGDLIEAGLPNITGNTTREIKSSNVNVPTTEWYGAMGYKTGNSDSYGGSGTSYKAAFLYLDASKSNPIYGNSTTVQPQTIKAFVYIVVANSTKTSIQVDIDNIATDLNGKADVDLSNTNDTAKILMSGMGMPSNKYIDLTLGASGSTYTAPANGWVLFEGGSTSGNKNLALTNETAHFKSLGITISGVSNCTAFIPVRKGDVVKTTYSVNTAITFRFIYAQGSESEAN